MKFLKYVIGIIIAISVIPIIIISIDKVTDPVDKTINFNILFDEDNDVHYLDPNVYDNLVLLMDIDDSIVQNLVSIKVDGNDVLSTVEDFYIEYIDLTGNMYLKIDDDNLDIIKNDGTILIDDVGEGIITRIADGPNPSVSMTFKVPTEIPTIVLVMLGLIPVVFISGILYVIFKKQNE